MTATTVEGPGSESTHSPDQIKSYVLRTDAISPCCVADVHTVPQALKDIEAYWLGTVPCRTVRLVGTLVSATEYESRSLYLVDDGTGTILCLKKRLVRLEGMDLGEGSGISRFRGYDIGDTVCVVGKIQEYKEVRQIYVSSIERCLLPDAESRHILDVLAQHRDRYLQPFTIPPLSMPTTPQKRQRLESQSNYASSMASTPTTSGFTSPTKSPKKDHARLRHPSRLRSKDLNENVFRIYVSHVMISTLSLPETLPEDSASTSENMDNSTPKPSRTRNSINLSNVTPKRPSRAPVDVFGSPTPKKQAAQYQLPPVPAEPSGPTLGVTLSYLRRIEVLADLARRVVDQAAHERDKTLRHVEKSARTKYEVLHACPPAKRISQPEGARSAVERSKAASSSQSRTSSRTAQPPTSAKATSFKPSDSISHHPPTLQKHLRSSSPSVSGLAFKSPSRASIQRTETLTLAEAARRAAYHAKQSKLRAEDTEKRLARTKRLFESALRTLVSEGEAVLHDGSRRLVPTSSNSSNSSGKRVASGLNGIWPDVTNTTAASSSRSSSTSSSVLSGITCPDLENAPEDAEGAELSDPSDSEDAYIPVTPQTLRPALLAALRRSLMRHKGGVDFDGWVRTLRGDEQWGRVPDLILKESLDILREEEWIDKVGGGRWDFTRGSWARSLTLS